MKKRSMVALGLMLLGFIFFPVMGWGAEPCPAELAEAKAALKGAQAALKKKGQTAKSQEIQAPRAHAGTRAQDVQAPRSQQDIQAPRSQDVQAPRSQQDIQAPRSQQDIQAPRSQDIQAPRIDKARALIGRADAACKKGDMALATQNAKEALALLK
jgi:hypothetical protein